MRTTFSEGASAQTLRHESGFGQAAVSGQNAVDGQDIGKRLKRGAASVADLRYALSLRFRRVKFTAAILRS